MRLYESWISSKQLWILSSLSPLHLELSYTVSYLFSTSDLLEPRHRVLTCTNEIPDIWKGLCSSSSFPSPVLGESRYLCWPLWGHRRPRWHNWFCSVSWFTTYKPLMTRIWWLVPFVLQWDGKLCRATYLRSNSPLITLQPRRGAFCSSTSATLTTSTRKYDWLWRPCMCIQCVHRCVCVVYVLLSKAQLAPLKQLIIWRTPRDRNATERGESLRFLSPLLLHSDRSRHPPARHAGLAHSACFWNEISGC